MITQRRKLHPQFQALAQSISYLTGAFITQKGGWIYIQANDPEHMAQVNRAIDHCIPNPNSPAPSTNH